MNEINFYATQAHTYTSVRRFAPFACEYSWCAFFFFDMQSIQKKKEKHQQQQQKRVQKNQKQNTKA